LKIKRLSSPYRRLDADGADGSAEIDVEHEEQLAALRLPKEKKQKKKRQHGSERVCRIDGCIGVRAKLVTVEKELKALTDNFNRKLSDVLKWHTDHASADAWTTAAEEEEKAKQAVDAATTAKKRLNASTRSCTSLTSQVASLTTSLHSAQASLEEKSGMLEQVEAEVDELQVVVRGYAHQEKKLAKLRGTLTELRAQSAAALATQAEAMEARRVEHAAQLEQARADAEAYSAAKETEMDEANAYIAELQAAKKALSPPTCTEEQWARYTVGGERWQRSMHVKYLHGIFVSSKWRGATSSRQPNGQGCLTRSESLTSARTSCTRRSRRW
jgi:chromosome segregation ATPase